MITIRGPSIAICGCFLLTLFLMCLKLDDEGVFPFKYDYTIMLLPLHALFVVLWMHISKSHETQASRVQRTSADDVLEDEIDNESVLLPTTEQVLADTTTNTAVAHMLMPLWINVITLNFQLEGWIEWPYHLVFIELYVHLFMLLSRAMKRGVWLWNEEQVQMQGSGVW